MRKDVKFGLTIGSILVVTLVVYIIVLNRGADDKTPNNQEVKLVVPEVGPAPTPIPPVPARVDGAGSRDPLVSMGNTITPSMETGGGVTPPPATVPSTDKPSWEALLESGQAPAPGDPEHTVTPMPPGHGPVSMGGHSLIDGPPSMMTIMPGAGPTEDVPPMVITPPPPTGPTTLPAVAGPRSHKVLSGETLSTISHAAYGNSKYWDKILGANPGLDPKHLKIGTILTIPDISNLPVSSAASDHGADLPPPGEGAMAALPTVPIDPATSYKVVQGDSLEQISIKLYGKRDMMDKIFDANKLLMGNDEDKLKIGWVLKLPSPPTVKTN